MSGERNSSRTRVCPAFTKLKNQIKDFIEWLNETQQCAIPTGNVDWDKAYVRFADKDGKGEIALPPCASLLKWMVDNFGTDMLRKECGKSVSNATRELRAKLLRHDPDTVFSAYDLINMGRRRGWFALEGYSRPDVYIETNKFILVVEGKRTEKTLTDSTTFFIKGRDQLIRHMDSALNVAGNKIVFGIIIYEEGAQYRPVLDMNLLNSSLPHRSAKEREMIKSHYLNPITWQDIGNKFGICYS